MWRTASLLLLLGCSDPLAWLEAVEPEPYTPPAIYHQWWIETEDCVGQRGDLDRIRWFVAESLPCPAYEDGCVGYWVAPHRIYILRPYVTEESVVRHEMIHAIRQRGGHPSAYFPRCDRTG